ncbi:glycerate kinase [Mycobacterium sp. KBS0706]|uniref:glycerate kinase family protein n=1 Tax=Mycobacterium sp. KBS0706 TaxID=2578109 RepID=UPI00110FD64C|nr:glycerate kinase [Mycobacterium sp. KBS0706]TSD84337.1 glycerate kinase [Mycobacterium sp. KBS0706]
MTKKSASRRLHVLIAPSGFKEGLGVREVADAMARGVRQAAPRAKITRVPMIDGGEGFTEMMVELTGGELHPVTVTGPVGQIVEAGIGFLGGRRKRVAVIEMAAAAGLRLVPKSLRDPTLTTSHGVGELIRAALDLGAERILVGCGDSGINDAGAGMAQALGVRLLDASERPIPGNGAALPSLHRIDLSGRDPRLERVRIDVAVNPYNMLLGEAGVARVFGPQKGATPDQVALLERGLKTFVRIVRRDLGIEVATLTGGGASGGLGAGLHAFAGARLHPRFDLILRHIDLDRRLAKADLVMTAEGGIDGQTRYGKVPAEIALRAKRYGLPVLALAGTVGTGADATREVGIDAVFGILKRPCSLEDAIRETDAMLAETAEQAVRLMLAARA